MSDLLYLLATNLVAIFSGKNIAILPTHIVEILLYLKPILLFLKDNEICRLYRLYIYISCHCNHQDIIISIG